MPLLLTRVPGDGAYLYVEKQHVRDAYYDYSVYWGPAGALSPLSVHDVEVSAQRLDGRSFFVTQIDADGYAFKFGMPAVRDLSQACEVLDKKTDATTMAFSYPSLQLKSMREPIAKALGVDQRLRSMTMSVTRLMATLTGRSPGAQFDPWGDNTFEQFDRIEVGSHVLHALRKSHFLSDPRPPTPGWYLVLSRGRWVKLVNQRGDTYKVAPNHPLLQEAWSPWKPPAFGVHILRETQVSRLSC